MIKNQKGFSLAEVVVTAGLIGVISLIVINLTKQSARSAKTLETNTEIITVLNEMRAILSDPAQCKKTFETINAANTIDAVDSLIYTNKAGLDINKFETQARNPNVRYGQGKLRIISYSLSDTSTDVNVAAEETTNLVVRFDRGAGVQGQRNINKNIKLWVDVNGTGEVIECRALSATSNLIWTRSNINQNDIFYSGGQVGVNIADPTDGFHFDVQGSSRVAEKLVVGDTNLVADSARVVINGELKLGQTTLNCNPQNEGSMRYDSVIKKMQFCNGTIWETILSGVGSIDIVQETVVMPTDSGNDVMRIAYANCQNDRSPISCGFEKDESAEEDSMVCRLELGNKRCKFILDRDEINDGSTGYCYCVK